MTEMEAEQQKARKKAQALDGIALLVEVAKDLWALLAKTVTCYVFEEYFIFVNYYFDNTLSMSRLKTVRV